jgi:hypothetical protein
MMKYSLNTVGPDITQVLSEDSERVFCRAWCLDDDGRLVGAAAAERSELRGRSINRSPNLQALTSGCSATGPGRFPLRWRWSRSQCGRRSLRRMGNKELRGRRSCSQSLTSIQRELGAKHLFQSRIVRFGEWP